MMVSSRPFEAAHFDRIASTKAEVLSMKNKYES
eukprot:COSAG02_NODE_39970_length_410_cov_1.366559_1_plen_32_part_10